MPRLPEVLRQERQRRRRQTATATDLSLYRDDFSGYCRDVLQAEPWAKQIEAVAAATRPPYRVLCRTGHSVGKCVYDKDMLTLADGSRVQAGELVGRTFQLLTLIGGKPAVVSACAERNRVEPVYRITTETGKTIVRNGAHPLWAADAIFANARKPRITPLGWTAVADIREGQLVAVAEQLPAFGSESMSDEKVKLLAYLIGDGGYTRGSVIFSQQDNKQLAEVRQCVEALGACLTKTPSKSNLYDYAITSPRHAPRVQYASRSPSGVISRRFNPVVELLKRHGLRGVHSRDKRVPAAIFRLSRQGVVTFLSRLYATDGWACATTRPEIGFCSASEGLVRDVQELLVRFGIHATVSKRTKVAAWTLNILAAKDVIRFAEEIGIYGKEEAVAAAVERAEQASREGRRWKQKKCPAGTLWERIRSVEMIGSADTVAIEVPDHHTYLTQFWEHNTWLAGALTSWWFDTRPDSCVLTTAPTSRDVRDLLWREVRLQRQRSPRLRGAGLVGTRAPELYDHPSHFAKGFTAEKGESFQGRHQEHMLFLFDEAVGIPSVFWDTTNSMFDPGGKHSWVCFMNPTDTTSRAYQEEEAGGWAVVSISCLEHPNLTTSLSPTTTVEGVGTKKVDYIPYPGAVTREQVREWLKSSWFDPIAASDATASDVEWEGQWYRPGLVGEARVLGRWPSKAAAAVWSAELWRRVLAMELPRVEEHWPLVIGCDVARFGDDDTAFVLRRGPCVLHAEWHNGWSTAATATRLKALCDLYRPRWQQTKQVPCMIDEGGLGAGVVDQADGYLFIGVNSSQKSPDEGRFPNRRSDLWFTTADLARAGLIDVSRLPVNTKTVLARQLMAPKYGLDSRGRSAVEPKDKTKETLRRSPDLADAFNMAFVVPAQAEKVGGRVR